MTQEPPRQLPQGAVQATGQVASDVVAGLKGQPMLLGIVVLNIIGIGIAGYVGLKFLEAVQSGDEQDRLVLRELMANNKMAVQELMAACFPSLGRRQDRGEMDAPAFERKQDRG